jgi:hypothetical protein
MPELAKSTKGLSTNSAYDGKRELAKVKIGKWLERRRFSVSGVTVPSQFNLAATYLELSLIYEDLARKLEDPSSMKSARYAALFEDEIENLAFDYVEPETGPPPGRTFSIPLYRG